MADVKFIDITKNLANYRYQLDAFLKGLRSEKKFFDLTIDRVISSVSVIVVIDKNLIIGIRGLEKKYLLLRGYTIVKKEYQGKGIGKALNEGIKKKEGVNHSLIMGIIHKDNNISINNLLSRGYRFVGKRGNLLYFCQLWNRKGLFIYYFLKIIWPIISVRDKLIEKEEP